MLGKLAVLLQLNKSCSCIYPRTIFAKLILVNIGLKKISLFGIKVYKCTCVATEFLE